jgi:hypothetical protein
VLSNKQQQIEPDVFERHRSVPASFPHFLAFFLLFCLSVAAAFAEPSMSASLDRDTISMGETVSFTLTFTDLAVPGAPTLPKIANINISGPSRSTQIRIENGVQSGEVNYIYTLTPTQPGDYTIPPMQAQVQGKTVTTEALKLNVLPPGVAGPKTDPLAKLAFLQVVLPKKEIYLGEVLPFDIQLYLVDGRELRIPQIEGDGFTVGRIIKTGQSRTTRDGQVFNIITLRTYVAAVKTGPLKLGPISMTLDVAKPGSRPTSIFDFGFQDYQTVTLTAEAQSVNVLPLPSENVPPGFNGIVGTFTMNVTAGPNNVAVGDPLTVKVQISGRGLLENINLPTQADWRDFKAYPPTSKVDSNDPLGLAGTKSFEQVLIPQDHETKFLPPLKFAFFDPEAKCYRTLSNAPIALTIKGAASAVAPVLTNTSSAQNNPPPVDDIVHIKSKLEPVGMGQALLLQKPLFLALQGVPFLVWAGLVVARKRREALANNPRLRRQREVARKVQEGLKDLRTHGEARRAEPFFALLFRLLQEQLGERLDLPASSITEAIIDERLRGAGLEKETLAELQGLFLTCNQARYAPTRSSQELVSLVPKLEKVLLDLQKWEPS